MKATIILSAFLLSHLIATAQPDQKARASFEKIVANFRTFFSSRQRLAYKQSINNSSTKELAYIIRYRPDGELTSDFPQSASADTLKATITMPFLRITNKSCGDIESGNEMLGWDNLASALANADETDCYTLAENEVHDSDPVQFNFSYEDGRWVLKSVMRTQYNRPDIPLTATMIAPIETGLAITEAEGIAFNKPWLDLLNQ